MASRTGFFIVAGFCIVVMVCGYWGFGSIVTDNATGQGKGLGVFKCKECEVFASELFSGRVMDVTTT